MSAIAVLTTTKIITSAHQCHRSVAAAPMSTAHSNDSDSHVSNSMPTVTSPGRCRSAEKSTPARPVVHQAPHQAPRPTGRSGSAGCPAGLPAVHWVGVGPRGAVSQRRMMTRPAAFAARLKAGTASRNSVGVHRAMASRRFTVVRATYSTNTSSARPIHTRSARAAPTSAAPTAAATATTVSGRPGAALPGSGRAGPAAPSRLAPGGRGRAARAAAVRITTAGRSRCRRSSGQLVEARAPSRSARRWSVAGLPDGSSPPCLRLPWSTVCRPGRVRVPRTR